MHIRGFSCPKLGLTDDSRCMGRRKQEHLRLPVHGASRADSLKHGVTAWQWRDERYARPFYGVGWDPSLRIEEEDDRESHPAELWRKTHLQLAMTYACIMKPGAFFAGKTAALLWKIPVPIDSCAPQLLEVGVETGAPFPRRTGVRGRRFSPRLVRTTVRDGLVMLDTPSIWASLGPTLDLPNRVALGDAIIRKPRIGGDLGPPQRPAYATLEELTKVSAQRGRRGKAELFEALPLLRTGSASAPESHLRLALVEADLPEPDLDFDVYDESDWYLGTTECVYSKYKIALEYEGDHHRTSVKQWNRDLEKQRNYESAGWIYVRISAQRLYRERAALMASIRKHLCSRGWCS